MKYEEYQKKIKKLRVVRNGVYHMRFPILGLTAASIITGIAIAGCVGVIQEQTTLDATYKYGEEIKIDDGKAFLSDMKYQYREKGDNKWSDEKPKDAGEYEYRTVSTNVFGGEKHGEIHRFAIEKMPIKFEITSDIVTYGDDPWVNLPILKEGDSLDFDFNFKSFKELSTEVQVSNVVITDANGQDVTARNYDIEAPFKKITFRQRVATINYGAKTEEYTGEKISVDIDPKIAVKGLLDTDKITFEGDPVSLVQVGNKSTYRKAKITNKDGIDVTHLYNIVTNVGELKVVPRKISLIGSTKNKTYDSYPAQLSFTYAPESKKLYKDHQFIVNFNETDTYSAGMKTTNFKVKVEDRFTHEDVSNFYDIEYQQQQYEIFKRDLTVITGHDHKYYGQGNAQSNVVQAQGLQGHDAIKFSPVKSLNSFGVQENAVTYDIYRDGIKVTDCYNIKHEFGTLTYEKRPITVVLKNAISKVYDGKPLTVDFNQFDILSSSESNGSSLGLCENHVAVAKKDEYGNDSKSIINAGEEINCSNFAIDIFEVDPLTHEIIDPFNPVTSNYHITPKTDGVAEITKRKISVKLPNIDKVYDGQLTGSEKPITVGSNTLASTDIFESIDFDKFVDSTENQKDTTNHINYINVTIVNEKTKRNVSDNYEIEIVDYGSVNIKRKNIHVAPKSFSKEYDGRPYKSSNAELEYWWDDNDVAFPFDLKVTADVYCDKIHVADSGATINIDPKTIQILKGDTNITQNFNIIDESRDPDRQGTLEITKRITDLCLAERDFGYESNQNFKYYDSLLIANPGLAVDDIFSNVQFVNFGTDIEADIPVLGQNATVGVKGFKVINRFTQKDNTNDYDFESTPLDNIKGVYKTHSENKIRLQSYDIEREYDGKKVELLDKERKIMVSGLDTSKYKLFYKFHLDDTQYHNLNYVNVLDTASLDEDNKIIYDGRARNDFDWGITEIATNKNVTELFIKDIEKIVGTVKIKPRNIVVSGRNEYNEKYDGQEIIREDLTDDGYGNGHLLNYNHREKAFISKGKMVNNDRLYIKNYTCRGYYGTLNRFENATFNLTYSDGRPADKNLKTNYNIVHDTRGGNVFVKKVVITIYMPSYDGIYNMDKDGEAQFDNVPEYDTTLLVGNDKLIINPTVFRDRTNDEVDGKKTNTLTQDQYYFVRDGHRLEDSSLMYEVNIIVGNVHIY